MPGTGVELATAYVSIVPDTSGLGRQLVARGGAEVQSSGRTMGSMLGTGLKTAAIAAVAVAAAAIGNEIRKGIGGAIAEMESLNKVDVVFGAASESVKSFASQGAKALGMAKGTALEYAGTLGNLLTATGLTDDAAAGMSTTMVKLSADLGSFNNTSPEDALEALRSGLAGETEPLKRFGVNLNEAILKQKAFELGFGEIKGTMDPAIRAQAAYAVIMEQTAKAQGDFARTSDGVANKQRIVAAQWEDIRNRIGSGFLPVIGKVQDVIIGVLDTVGGGKGLAGLFPPELQAQFATFRTAIDGLTATVMPTIAGWYDTIIKPAMDKIKAAFAPVAAEIIPTVTAIVNFVRENWPAIQQAIEPVMNAVSNLVTGVMQFIGGIIRAVMAVIRGDWSAAWEGIKTAFAGVVNVIRGSNIGLALEQGFAIVKMLPDRFRDMRDKVVGFIQDLLAKLRGPIDKIKDILSNLNPFQRHSPSLVDNVLAGVGVIRGAYASLSGMSIAGPAIMGVRAGSLQPTPASASPGGMIVNFNQPVRSFSETLRAMSDIERGLAW